MVIAMNSTKKVPGAFILRRLHSLTGFWLSIFLIEHLLTNSQAALWIGDDGKGFIHGVNLIKNLPYLQVIEIFLLGVPIVIHMVWGILYARTGVSNSMKSDGSAPALTEFPRNHAYTWQRITSWILVFLLVGHIVHMRFIEYPVSAKVDAKTYYMTRVNYDEGLPTVAERLNARLYDRDRIELQKKQVISGRLLTAGVSNSERLEVQNELQEQEFIEALNKRPLGPGQVIVVAPDFGTATLFLVRDTFKVPIMLALYTIFVLSACFHGYNGLWTFLITWGVSLTERSQRLMRMVSNTLMAVIAFLGLAAIWGTYWVNLRY